MTVFKVLTYPHVLLKKKSTPVEKFTPGLKKFVDGMIATMNAFEGIGLAAPQVGICKRILIMDISHYDNSDSPTAKDWKSTTIFKRSGKEEPLKFPMALVNPEIISETEAIIFPFDGCLSFPGGSGYDSRRFKKITLRAQDVEGTPVEVQTDGILSICLQHEIDHLEGILFIDRLVEGSVKDDVLSVMAEYEDSTEYRKKLKKLKPIDARSEPLDFV
jgi:peptide deformylase